MSAGVFCVHIIQTSAGIYNSCNTQLQFFFFKCTPCVVQSQVILRHQMYATQNQRENVIRYASEMCVCLIVGYCEWVMLRVTYICCSISNIAIYPFRLYFASGLKWMTRTRLYLYTHNSNRWDTMNNLYAQHKYLQMHRARL